MIHARTLTLIQSLESSSTVSAKLYRNEVPETKWTLDQSHKHRQSRASGSCRSVCWWRRREVESRKMPGLQQQQHAPITVEQLVHLNPYNPDILPDLESYVQEQVRGIFCCSPPCAFPVLPLLFISYTSLSIVSSFHFVYIIVDCFCNTEGAQPATKFHGGLSTELSMQIFRVFLCDPGWDSSRVDRVCPDFQNPPSPTIRGCVYRGKRGSSGHQFMSRRCEKFAVGCLPSNDELSDESNNFCSRFRSSSRRTVWMPTFAYCVSIRYVGRTSTLRLFFLLHSRLTSR